jgi:hypothetical protein
LLSRSPASIFRTAAVDAYLVPRFGEEFAAPENDHAQRQRIARGNATAHTTEDYF